ncbi:TetR/AcrR family transcriptional regulator [Priestia megaterium]|uniref:TetR/AcrR family transcriptional regulator n=1 Tax=Priestia megaterium TaxID=1404 RepID=UPI00366CD89D
MNTNKEHNRSSQDEMRNKLLEKVIPIVRKHGFQSVRMDDMAKHMDVSKATMYKYFASKEEIMEGAVAILVDYIDELVVESQHADQSFGVNFQQLFEQSISLAAYISDVFLQELQTLYPHLHSELQDAMQKREEKMISFYEEGKEKGIFHSVNEKLLFLQDDVLVRSMLDIKFLMMNHLTLQQVLFDYYTIKKLQLFKPDKLALVDDSEMADKLDYIAKKFTRDLF